MQDSNATQTTTVETAAPRERVYVVRNGRQVEALTPERIQSMIAGMEKKGKMLSGADAGRLIEGILVVGDGTPFEGPIGLQYIYNTDLLSEVAYSGNKFQAATDALNEAISEANGDIEAIHDACRSFMNALTISFSTATQKFANGELIQARVELVTTDRGSLLTLRNASHQRAEKLKAKPASSFNLTQMLAARKTAKATELADGGAGAPTTGEQPAPVEGQPAETQPEAPTAQASAQVKNPANVKS